jgi:DNA-binding NarL/FixJ family response regulator
VDALAAGARGVIHKDAPITDVVRAVHAVDDGSVWAPRHVVLDAWLRHRRSTPDAAARFLERRLSNREAEVLRWVATGMTNKELAERLAISPATVKAHLTRIFEKVGIRRRAELIATYHAPAMPPPASAARDRRRR